MRFKIKLIKKVTYSYLLPPMGDVYYATSKSSYLN
jgi:hypothetical protein